MLVTLVLIVLGVRAVRHPRTHEKPESPFGVGRDGRAALPIRFRSARQAIPSQPRACLSTTQAAP